MKQEEVLVDHLFCRNLQASVGLASHSDQQPSGTVECSCPVESFQKEMRCDQLAAVGEVSRVVVAVRLLLQVLHCGP